jgi:ATP-dependent protease ClpP protease subunit
MRSLPRNLGQLRAAWRLTNDIAQRDTPCFRVTNADSAKPKLYVYDVIGGWDMDAGEFVRAVHDLDADSLDLHINSPGGFVYDAVAMFEALDQSAAAVDVHIDGLAASAASFLAMAGDTVEIAKGGRMMIHDAQGIGIGGPADMREYADMLDAVSDDISGYYAARAGGKPADWRKAMTAETWYSSSEAKAAKLVDSVAAGKKTNTDSAPDNRTRLIRARAAVTLKG